MPNSGTGSLACSPKEMEGKLGTFSAYLCARVCLFPDLRKPVKPAKPNAPLEHHLLLNSNQVWQTRSLKDNNFLWDFWNLFSENTSALTWRKQLQCKLILTFRHQGLNMSSAYKCKSTGDHTSLDVPLRK